LLSSRKQLQQLRFINDLHAELLRLLEFRSRLLAGENEIGFLADAAADFAALSFDSFEAFGQSASELCLDCFLLLAQNFFGDLDFLQLLFKLINMGFDSAKLRPCMNLG
jgi:hypothetical protein